MPQFESVYQGQLRTRIVHVPSGADLLTDAPTDNHGKGESFSPTDLVSAALGSCMMTIMGILANREGFSLEGVRWNTRKIMQADPRRVGEVQIEFHFPPQHGLSEVQQEKLRRAAATCPVALSLHPDVRQNVTFHF